MSPTLKLVRGEIENIQYNSLDINRQSNIHMELLTKINKSTAERGQRSSVWYVDTKAKYEISNLK